MKKGDNTSTRLPTPVKLPSGNWRCRTSYVDEDGKKHTASFTESTFILAQTKALAWRTGIIKQIEQKKDMTVDQAITEYIESLEARRASPSTIRDYIGRQKKAFPLIANKRVSRITLLDIQRQIDARSKEVAPKTVHNDFALLSPALRLRREDLNMEKIRLPEIDNDEMEIPSYDEAMDFLELTKKRDGLYCAALLACALGLRRSEICALEWKDIDTRTGIVTIDKAMVLDRHGDWVIKQPKKKSSRRKLFIEREIIEELQRHRTDFVRVTDMNPNQVTNEVRRVFDSLGMREYHLHTLRHYKASVVLSLGFGTDTARRILGHKTENMVKRVYGHLTPEAKVVAKDRISEHNLALLTRRKIDYLPQAPFEVTRASEN